MDIAFASATAPAIALFIARRFGSGPGGGGAAMVEDC